MRTRHLQRRLVGCVVALLCLAVMSILPTMQAGATVLGGTTATHAAQSDDDQSDDPTDPEPGEDPAPDPDPEPGEEPGDPDPEPGDEPEPQPDPEPEPTPTTEPETEPSDGDVTARTVEANGPYFGVVGQPITLYGTISGFPDGVEILWQEESSLGVPCDWENEDTLRLTLTCHEATPSGVVYLTVTDPETGLVQDGADIRIAEADDPPAEPTVDARGPYVTAAGERVALDGHVWGIPSASLRWDTEDDLGCTFDDATFTDTGVTCTEVGETRLVVNVVDLDTGAVYTDVADLVVHDPGTDPPDIPPDPDWPVADAQGPYEAVVGEPFTLQGTTSGFSEHVTVSWDAHEVGCTRESSDTLTPTLTCDEPVSGPVELTVLDLVTGKSDSDTAHITVRSEDDPPPDPAIETGGPYEAEAGARFEVAGQVYGFPAVGTRWSTSGADLGCTFWDDTALDSSVRCTEPGETRLVLLVTDLQTGEVHSAVTDLTIQSPSDDPGPDDPGPGNGGGGGGGQAASGSLPWTGANTGELVVEGLLLVATGAAAALAARHLRRRGISATS